MHSCQTFHKLPFLSERVCALLRCTLLFVVCVARLCMLSSLSRAWRWFVWALGLSARCTRVLFKRSTITSKTHECRQHATQLYTYYCEQRSWKTVAKNKKPNNKLKKKTKIMKLNDKKYMSPGPPAMMVKCNFQITKIHYTVAISHVTELLRIVAR